MPTRPPATPFRKSTYSAVTGCVEVATTRGAVHVRDSTLGDTYPVLDFTTTAWTQFLTAVRTGQLTTTIDTPPT